MKRAERIKTKIAERLEKQRAFTETVPRPQNPGDKCWKCGTILEYRETKGTPKPHQTYAFRGYLWCDGCGTLYHCEKYKYQIAPLMARKLPPGSLDRQMDYAIAKDQERSRVLL